MVKSYFVIAVANRPEDGHYDEPGRYNTKQAAVKVVREHLNTGDYWSSYQILERKDTTDGYFLERCAARYEVRNKTLYAIRNLKRNDYGTVLSWRDSRR